MSPVSLDADLLTDRRRIKRRLSFWRALAIVAVLGAIAVASLSGRGLMAGARGGEHVARLTVAGTIGDDRRVIEAIDRAARDTNVRALILEINSPGGSMSGGEALHGAIARFAETKPVIATMGGLAASAGYMIAMPAHRVLAREATITGSIGVILQSFNVVELMSRLGVQPEVIASGPLKDQPSPFRALSPEGRAAMERLIGELHGQFIRMVATGRHMDEARVRELADGRVVTGREAVGLGLVDAIGGEREARAWLAAERQVPDSLPIRAIETRSRTERWFQSTIGFVVKSLFSEWLGVDGPRAIWQPLL
ncbi:signal peptide peptidase SppA [Plastoroseomonas arctica]|uniref:Signal peptide peptidase SppA n=1 Tax=Plastoroseomonas arctica TaxID=1509237 RepID=A0AAF1KKZ6_9PROT|nr:signal peptide peptidase SppA [Plastoroseomonas arctica]MBR0654101.1 signal peptide peptidase SppA [Plastoroseomonas arctica]